MRKPRPLPLFDHVPGPPEPELRRNGRLAPALLLAAGAAALLATIALPVAPRLLWNASASAPVGLYAVSSGSPLRLGDMVVAWAPTAAREMAARRHYLPRTVPLLKRVAAVPGDTICANDLTVTINGRPSAIRRASDGSGRALPAWRGCMRLADGQYLLLMTKSPDSFDGRYFGATKTAEIVGKATPLWLP